MPQHAKVDDRLELAAARQAADASQADLLASQSALASSREETKIGKAELLISETALAWSQAETKIGLADLVASAVALASSRAENKISLADLLASAVALSLSRAETEVGQSDLRASRVANRALSLANASLITNEEVLEDLVERRTAALMREVDERHRAEEALRQGEKLQAIGQLTGGVAHDLNNILQLVFTGTTLLRMPELMPDRRAAVLDTIEHAAERARQLTNRLLAFARRQALQPKAFDINVLVAGLSGLLAPTLGQDMRVITDFAPSVWPVIADPNQLEVAILNLATNARDAMQPAGGTLTLRVRNMTLAPTAQREGGDFVSLAVIDTGHGMPEHVMAHVFEPFFTTKAPGKGTGLGLAQVYGFAKQSGGDIHVESKPGQGTSVFIHLPRASEAALAAASAAQPRDTAASYHSQCGAGRTILVVEDNIDLAGFTIAMLESSGYATRHAANADDALQLLAGGDAVDAVFSDVVMPGSMNGMQLAGEVRRIYPQLAVVLATGYSQTLNQWNGPAVAEVLSKPYRLHDLTAALGRAFATVAVAPS